MSDDKATGPAGDLRVGWIRTTVQAVVGAALASGPVVETLDAAGVHINRQALIAFLTAAAISLWWRVGSWAQTRCGSGSLCGRVVSLLMGGPPPRY